MLQKAVVKDTISRWIPSVIKLAYTDLSFLRIRPQEFRALSTSWAFSNYVQLEDILVEVPVAFLLFFIWALCHPNLKTYFILFGPTSALSENHNLILNTHTF